MRLCASFPGLAQELVLSPVSAPCTSLSKSIPRRGQIVAFPCHELCSQVLTQSALLTPPSVFAEKQASGLRRRTWLIDSLVYAISHMPRHAASMGGKCFICKVAGIQAL
ncbi:hypothetical protein OBBRIDRAFT_464472 [Obba rivulosa]|uniref:Uncharacterized protein n=1 Tax=Obba rivulosa TaxID=1052685 RepID=A0A8E2B5C9_9APHY|nr:hypothetical protein OBBRIDRAFT_464472 [Obba rivulosa]